MRGAALLLAACAVSATGCRDGVQAPRTTSVEKTRILAFWESYRQATERRVVRDFESAVARYTEALTLDPRHEDSLYYLGQCERERGRVAQARSAFERLLTVNPRSGRGHLALGALLASPDPGDPLDLSGAESHFRTAHDINAEETGPMVRLAEVLIVSDRAQEARTWLEAAVRTNARSVEAALLAAALAWSDGDRAAARRLADVAQAAAQAVAPVRGVLNEGDRRAARSRAAPPALENPMGRMLFGNALAGVRASMGSSGSRVDLAALWSAVSRARSDHARRAARSTS